MLRKIVLLLLLLNAALFFWSRSDPTWLQGDREPQRWQQQVHPEAIRALPDLAPIAPAPPASAAASEASASAPPPASGASSADASASPIRKAGVAEVNVCAESNALTPQQWSAVDQALARAGIPATAISAQLASAPPRWIVYMGRYAEPQQWQHKADELRRLGLKFERVSTPPALDPGLSLGSFASAEQANGRLEELGRRGVHTARVVQSAASAPERRMQVKAPDGDWRSAVPGVVFRNCPPASATL